MRSVTNVSALVYKRLNRWGAVLDVNSRGRCNHVLDGSWDTYHPLGEGTIRLDGGDAALLQYYCHWLKQLSYLDSTFSPTHRWCG